VPNIDPSSIPWTSLIVGLIVFAVVLWILSLRRIIHPNTVHIVQSSGKRVSYGTGADKSANAYIEWPSFLPVVGVTVLKLPVNNFDLTLTGYDAFDKDRVPFLVDITAFFRIDDTNMAAQRIASVAELERQLVSVVQGAARKILATHDIDTIMVNRATFGDQFTSEVAEQLKAWGVVPVKNIELMNIRDAKDSHVIANIMAKKMSHIDMLSRTEVANNKRLAAEAEIAAQREVDLRKQDALQTVGQRTAQQEQSVGIAKEQAQQEVQREARVTRERQMDVLSVETQRKAEIVKAAAITAAEQARQTTIVNAEGEKEQMVLHADGKLAEAIREADGVKATGAATAEAKRLMELAPISAQIELAKEIGENVGYQNYLIDIRKVEATEKIGVQQADALKAADIKIIANAGSAATGIASLGEVVSSKGGQQIGAMLEGLAQTERGAAVLDSVSRIAGGGKK
jgi:flotillin